MSPEDDLPLPSGYQDDERYVTDLLEFVSSSQLLQTLVGGVHVLDFFVNEPDLYQQILDADWRAWFELHDIDELIDFFLRDDLDHFPGLTEDRGDPTDRAPQTLLHYIKSIRALALVRDIREESHHEPMPYQLGLGMSQKKKHEVMHFARFVLRLTADLATTDHKPFSHLIDFGAGQGYLNRFLASKPHNMQVIAVEGRAHNIKNAQWLDVSSNLIPKKNFSKSKKKYLVQQEASSRLNQAIIDHGTTGDGQKSSRTIVQASNEAKSHDECSQQSLRQSKPIIEGSSGSVLHVQRRLEDGNLQGVINDRGSEEKYLVMSLHSCGNLTHHALRSITLNPAVKAVAVVGCCYNLTTERFSPPTYKLHALHPRSRAAESSDEVAWDPHGFPMSRRLCDYVTPAGKGFRINITARMMAVQAPLNWGPDGSRAFFTRHFYRALLQRILLDKGVIDLPVFPIEDDIGTAESAGRNPAGTGSTQPIIIGSLGRKPYRSFVSYVRAAIKKLRLYGQQSGNFYETMDAMTDEEIGAYEDAYLPRKKELSIIWTLMAFSATLIEALIVIDRWLWLKEQDEVERCWVEPVFDYAKSPRNLVVVGIKKLTGPPSSPKE